MTKFFGANGVSTLGADLAYTITFAVLTVLVMLPVIWLLTKYIRRPKYAETYAEKVKAYEAGQLTSGQPVKFSFTGILFAIIGISVIIRLVFAFFVTGYRGPTGDVIDNDSFNSLFSLFGVGDLAANYPAGQDAVAHYPLITYIYSFLGLFVRAFSLTADSFAASFFVKLPMILADVGLICLLYVAAKKYVNEYVALIVAGFAAIFPPFIFASSVWGSVYSILAFLIALTFYCIATKNFPGLFIAYALALYTAKDALYLFPVVAIFVIYQFIKSALYVRKNKLGSIKEMLSNSNAKNLILIPIYIVVSWLVMWLAALPLIHNYSVNPFKWMYMFFFYPLSQVTSYGYNALNIFNLFIRNGMELGAGFPAVFFSIMVGVIITLLVLLVYLSRKNRANLVYLAGYCLFTLSVFFVDFGAMNLITVLALLLLSLIFVRDRRILTLVVMLGLCVVLNASFVMMSAGYFNTLPASAFAGGIYTGDTLLFDNIGWLAANIAVSAVTVLLYAYATLVILDIAMSNKRKLFADITKPSFGRSLIKFIKD